MAFSDSSVLVLDDSGATHSYETNKSDGLSITIPAGASGVWAWVVSRRGYSCQSGTFDISGGGRRIASPTPQLLTQANGSLLYSASTTPNVSIDFDLTTGSEICFIDIGDAEVSPQQVVDAIELALETESGCKFLIASNCSQTNFSELGGQKYLLLGSQYRLRRRDAGDFNATLSAFVISADGSPIDGVNGSINLLSSSSGIPFID